MKAPNGADLAEAPQPGGPGRPRPRTADQPRIAPAPAGRGPGDPAGRDWPPAGPIPHGQGGADGETE
jgi:hypothetical protein